MKDDRYEIKEKIGQGGIGAVYKAWDKRLNRDVAIKRVLPESGFENEEEATEHLLKEATALSSVQHPHIVTVYDAGVDEDGPYVVMELLAGKTLDEMIDQGTLVLPDFREVAIQSQEALIAAQDLNLVHRDLKPTNVMVIWLASGKFQIKIVDFGLAKFSPNPSLQTIDHGDAVFGSIHFMAPEQFERNPLDQRTDMYAMGCLYYYTLTGLYPFSADSSPGVMAAHLAHTVTPLQELRPELPAWVCDWVMWHISRKMDDRPENARQSLQKFLMSEQQNPTEPEEDAKPAEARPKFVFPGGTAAAPPQPATDAVPAVPTGTAPQAIQPPANQQPLVPDPPKPPAATPQTIPLAKSTPLTPPAPLAQPAPPIQLTPPTTVKLATPPAPVNITPAAPAPPATPANPLTPAPGTIALAGAPVAVAAQSATPAAPDRSPIISSSSGQQKKGLSTAAKSTIAAVLGIAVILVGIVVISKISSNQKTASINALLAEAKDPTARNVPTTSAQISDLLAAAKSIESNSDRQAVYQRLLISAPSDGSDVDQQIAKFATDDNIRMLADTRIQIFVVLQGRKSPVALPFLIEHARSTASEQTAAAALRACEKIATENNLADLLNIMRYTKHSSVRQAAKRTIAAVAAVAKRTDGRAELASALKNAYETAGEDEVKRDYLELLGSAGGDDSAAIIRSALADDDKKTQLAAVAALRAWPDDTMFSELIDYATGQEDDFLRSQSFNAAFTFLKLDRERDEFDLGDLWKMLAAEAYTTKEKVHIINGMSQLTDDWAFSVIAFFEEDDDDKVSYRAEQAKEHMESRRKRIQGGEDE